MRWMLNTDGCCMKTGVQAVKARHYEKSSSVNGLKTSRLSKWRRAGKSSRNMFKGRKTSPSGINQLSFGTMPMSSWAPLIATKDVMDATNLELKRLRYDYRASEHFRAAAVKRGPSKGLQA